MLSKIRHFLSDLGGSRQYLKEAMVFFPRNAESNEAMAMSLRPYADSKEKLLQVEMYLKKAIVSGVDADTTRCRVELPTGAAVAAGQLPTSSSGTVPTDEAEFVERDTKAALSARRALGLLLCQEGRYQEAATVLSSAGFRWRVRQGICRIELDSTR
jgi:hypothetical protein